jgi:DNA invertase Pin-like site-specific DNA recombinase
MVTKHSNLVPAVSYLRRSTDKQEASLPEQRRAVQQYAQDKGYNLLREYVDDAISGDDTKNRAAFLQMVRDAAELGDFKAILCWDTSRFGRFDSIELGYYAHQLRLAGVHLATVQDGVIDWTDETGRIVNTVQQEGKNKWLRDHSANVTRGQAAAIENGSHCGKSPYGYRLEGPKKNKRLVLGEAAHIRIVERIFREFVEEGRPMMNIADRLNEEGVVSPGGRPKGWRWDTVKVILENPAYAGDFAGGRSTNGKYHNISSGTVVKSEGRRRRQPENKWKIIRDHHEPIIARPLWEAAQAILAKGKTGRSPHGPDTNPYLLSNKLRCGRCGGPMWGEENRNGYRRYECGAHKYGGDECCLGTNVREDDVLRSLADSLSNLLGPDRDNLEVAAYHGWLTPEDEASLPAAFHKVKALLIPPQLGKSDRKRLEKRLEKTKAQVATARRNLAHVKNPANIAVVEEEISGLEQEQQRLESELRRTKPPAAKDLNQAALELLYSLSNLVQMCGSLALPSVTVLDKEGRPERWVDNRDGTYTRGTTEAAAPREFKKFLRRVSGITVFTRIKGRGNGIRHKFERGDITYLPVGPDTGNLNPHVAG